jgi:DNA-binding CsgD family transcriptional regulator
VEELRNSLYGFEMREEDRRRVPVEERKSYDIKQLWQRSHEILYLSLLGLKNTEIAIQLNITEATVSHTINSELGMKKLSEMRRERDEAAMDVAKEVDMLLPLAINTYRKILSGEDVTKLQKETADTLVMDIKGNRAPAKIESAHLYLTKSDIDELKKRGLGAAKASGMLVDSKSEDEHPPTIN